MLTCNFCGQTVLGSSAKRVKVANFNPKNNPSSMKPTVRAIYKIFKGYRDSEFLVCSQACHNCYKPLPRCMICLNYVGSVSGK